MTRTSLFMLVILWGAPCKGVSQVSTDSLFRLPDTLQRFSIERFFALLAANHPMVKQARLLSENARQEVRLARGSFDPKIQAAYGSKDYQGVNYFEKVDASLTVPTWFPVDPKLGWQQNSGSYVNPESSLPPSDNYRQIIAGISLPLGRGLVTDERRAAVKQARLFTEFAEAEQVKLINKILLDAAKDYWQWCYAYYHYRLLDNNVRIVEEILRRVTLNAALGEASAIDTVQARISLQQRLIDRQEALLDLTNHRMRISTYLWDENEEPLDLSLSAAPILDTVSGRPANPSLSELKRMAQQNHPELQKINIKLDQLEVDRKLAAEYLKPRLDLQYGLINQPFRPDGGTPSLSFGQDYRLGAEFSIPLLLRKERSKLGLAKLKIRGSQLERSQTEREILNQVEQVYNQLSNIQLVLAQQTSMVSNYERLLNAELLNLEWGESDPFKISVQQERLVQAQTKKLKLLTESEKLKATLYWAAGIRHLGMLP